MGLRSEDSGDGVGGVRMESEDANPLTRTGTKTHTHTYTQRKRATG